MPDKRKRALSVEESLARFGQYPPPLSEADMPAPISKTLQAYEDAMAWNAANLKYVREADELIDLVFNHTNSAMRQRKVAEYLSQLVGDEVAAAEAEADAERAKFAKHAFSHGTSPDAAETTTERPEDYFREARQPDEH